MNEKFSNYKRGSKSKKLECIDVCMRNVIMIKGFYKKKEYKILLVVLLKEDLHIKNYDYYLRNKKDKQIMRKKLNSIITTLHVLLK